MAEYTLTLRSDNDYRIIKKLLKAFEGASIRPLRPQGENSHRYGIKEALEEAKAGKIVGPFNSTEDLMADLLK